MQINYKDKIIDFLKQHKEQKFSPNALAKWFVENYPEEARKQGDKSRNKKMLKANTLEKKRKIIIGIYRGEISSSKLSIKSKKEYGIKIDTKPKMKFYYTQTPETQVNTNLKLKSEIPANKKKKNN